MTRTSADQAGPPAHGTAAGALAADPAWLGRWLAGQLNDPARQDRASTSIGHGRSNLTFAVPAAVTEDISGGVPPLVGLGRRGPRAGLL